MLVIFSTHLQYINLYSDSPMQRARNLDVIVNHIFGNTRVGIHCTGCSFTLQIVIQYQMVPTLHILHLIHSENH